MAITKNLLKLKLDTVFNPNLFPKDRWYKFRVGMLEAIQQLDVDSIQDMTVALDEGRASISLVADYDPEKEDIVAPEGGFLNYEEAYRDMCSIADENAPKPIPVDGKWMCPECETVSTGEELETDLDGCRSCPECGYVLFTPEEWRDMT